MAIELGSPLPPVPFRVAQCGCLTDRLQVDVLSAEALLSPQHGVVEGFKVLGGIGVAEEPIESCPDKQRAEKCPLRVVGFRKEQLLCPGESFGIELLQGRVGGDQRILQSPGPEAELLRVFALQHCGEAHGPLGTWQSSALRVSLWNHIHFSTKMMHTVYLRTTFSSAKFKPETSLGLLKSSLGRS